MISASRTCLSGGVAAALVILGVLAMRLILPVATAPPPRDLAADAVVVTSLRSGSLRSVAGRKAGERRGEGAVVVLPPRFASCSATGSVYVTRTDHGVPAYLFPEFVTAPARRGDAPSEIAGLVFVDGPLSVDRETGAEWLRFPGLAPVQAEVEGDGSGWFRLDWRRGVAMRPIRRGPADPTRAGWYFAQPFYDD